MKENDSLDALLVKEGTVMTEEEIIDTKKVIEAIDDKMKPKLAYNDDITPGSEIEVNTEIMTQEEANMNMVKQVAMNKLEKEKQAEAEAFAKMSENEKIKTYVCQAEYWRNFNDFYSKHGYEMSGHQKHILKRKIEQLWKKGKYRLTEQQKQDILYEINKASYSADKNKPTSEKKVVNMADFNSMLMK